MLLAFFAVEQALSANAANRTKSTFFKFILNNFLIKKLGLSASDKLDEAITEVMDQMGSSNRNKYRVMVYYLLVLKFKKQSVYNS